MKLLSILSFVLLTACGSDTIVSVPLEPTGPDLCLVADGTQGTELIDGQWYAPCE